MLIFNSKFTIIQGLSKMGDQGGQLLHVQQ